MSTMKMNIIKVDNRIILKSSTHEPLKHSCIEYSVEKRKKMSNVEYIVIVIILFVVMYTILTGITLLCFNTVITLSISLLLSLRVCSKVHNESLLIAAPIGLQLTTTYITGRQMVFSLPWTCISDILIIDVIHTQQVLFYLAVKTYQNGLIILFQKSAPRLQFLEIIYKDVHKLLEHNR
ncbi:phosphatidylinositol N-acetylglucosaminyltransferase subunit H-like [Adelges cooleyi]|uniref:phosphatidylinositol N-acetylglucosaminyltransferase subunit H-like n=1 Tax=Adelges cooleyi TaxID=133065 RepID=UPI00217FF764|nr:phosphatidylinositol N-acetylglucosaminyltransferase subunit H-like [Adelges cooleyi]